MIPIARNTPPLLITTGAPSYDVAGGILLQRVGHLHCRRSSQNFRFLIMKDKKFLNEIYGKFVVETPQPVNAWKDMEGKFHDTPEAATMANHAIVRSKLRDLAETVILQASQLDHPDPDIQGRFSITKLEHFNAEFLQPLADFVALLIAESNEKINKYG